MTYGKRTHKNFDMDDRNRSSKTIEPEEHETVKSQRKRPNQPKTNEKPPKKGNQSSHDYRQENHQINRNIHTSNIDADHPKQVGSGHYLGNTPQTTQTNKGKDKSMTRTNIFSDSPGRERTPNKYNQKPKIEPKERKNTVQKQSNKKMMMNAITYTCLPGQLNKKEREKLLDVLENETSSEFFIFLFKQYARKVIKGIYVMDFTQNNRVRKIYGEKAPEEISEEQVHSFFQYDSGGRTWKRLDGNKSFSLVIQAVALH